MKQYAVYGTGQHIDLENGEIGLHSTPAVTKSGVVIVGSSFREGNAPKTHNNTKGLVMAFDVRTGKKLWQFNTIPRPGEFGQRHMAEGVLGYQRQHRSLDSDRRRRATGPSLPSGRNPDSDYYGGQRPGNNLFAETLVCVDLKTGQRKWHFQLVHHPIWDYDISCRADTRRLNVMVARQDSHSANETMLAFCIRSRHG